LSVYNSLSGITLWIGLTRPSAPAHTTCRIGVFTQGIVAVMLFSSSIYNLHAVVTTMAL